MKDLEDMVWQALGEASMCWSERPKGEFDQSRVKRIGEELLQAIREYNQAFITLKPAKMKNLHVTKWCSVCHKAKGYSGTLVMGETNDEDAQEFPEQCMCAFFSQQPTSLSPLGSLATGSFYGHPWGEPNDG